MSYPIEPRWPTPLYVPTWWEKRFPWLLDYLAWLDLDPLWALAAPLLRPFQWLTEIVMGPPATLLDWVAPRITALWQRVTSGAWQALAALPMPGIAKDLLWLRPVEPFRPLEHDAHAVLKRQYKTVRRWSYIAAFTLHGTVITLWPAADAEAFSSTSETLVAITLPPEIPIPPPPPAILRPASPVIGPANIEDDVTIPLTTFEDNPVATLPPPPAPVAEEQTDQLIFTPHTVAPSVLNRSEIRRLLEAEYPPLLRSAGVGGVVRVAFFIDEEGRLGETRVFATSGHPTLDQAALRVAERFQFSPALDGDRKVATWIQFPIAFSVR